MVYRFRILSDENKDFARELLIHSEQSFLDFHHCIQENLGFDPKQLASFFLTNSVWEKQLQITLIDMMDDEGGNCITMDQAIIDTYISTKGQRLIYVFDFFSERSFFIELTEILDIKEAKSLPKIAFSHGDPPIQIELGLEDVQFLDEGFEDDLSMDSPDDDFSDDFDFIDSDDYQDD